MSQREDEYSAEHVLQVLVTIAEPVPMVLAEKGVMRAQVDHWKATFVLMDRPIVWIVQSV